MQQALPTPRRPLTRRVLHAFVALAVAVSFPLPASAASDAYAADPLRLVPFADTVQQVYSQGTDVWEVWICRVPGWSIAIDVSQVVDGLNATATPYFEWLSDSRYSPSFVPGGEVTSDDVISPSPEGVEGFSASGCEAEVATASPGGANGALIVVAGGFADGYATAGAVCPEPPFTGCQTTYPANARRVVVGAGTVTALPPLAEPQWATLAHEIGHALNWPHSYGGLNAIDQTGRINPYDNPMDIMSASVVSGIPLGTVAYNRYAAGWIDPGSVAVHASGSATYRLGALGETGLQMVVIPLGGDGNFFTLGARRRSSYDAAIPVAGVEVYEVDQRATACARPSRWPADWPCFATFTRIAQTPAEVGVDGVAHVLTLGSQLAVGPFEVTVTAADLGGFTVQISDVTSGRFIDDNGNPHEANIEAIAAVGVTNGCNPPTNDRYCPSQETSRAEMAAFLIRALGEEANLPSYQGYFPDVAAGEWYTPYVERLFELGVTTGFSNGTYQPEASVSRGEMAAFLIRAFGYTGNLTDPTGLFVDVAPDVWYAAQVELLYQLGITTGCTASPLAYCPDAPVLRDQMASFLARAMGISG